MKRGEIWWVDFNPSIGGEINKIRPAVILSNNIANKVMNRIQVAPITSNTDKCYPCEAFIMLKDQAAKVMADQPTTVSKTRLKSKISQLSAQEMFALEQAVKLQLALK
jgi:mRNA interferase MazF